MDDINSVVYLKDGVIFIDFNKIYDFDEKESHEGFGEYQLVKRNYINMSEKILNVLRTVFDFDYNEKNDNRIIDKYFWMTYKILDNHKYSYDKFIDDILKNFIYDMKFTNNLNQFVAKNHQIRLEDKLEYIEKANETKRKKVKINHELQFNDDHALSLVTVSILIKFFLPIISLYLIKFYEKKNFNKTLYITFIKLLNIFQKNNVQIFNKIYKFIHARVLQTQYSDKMMWNYLKNLSKNQYILTNDLFKKIVIDVIPKLDINKDVTSFLHVIIKNQINYAFEYSYPIKYNPINMVKENRNGLINYNKLEINILRKDEGINIINKISFKELVRQFAKDGICITEKELQYYENNIDINKIQNILLGLFYSKYFLSFNILYILNYKEYVYILIIFKKWLIKNNFHSLSDIIDSKVKEDNIQIDKLLNRKKFMEQLNDSKMYNTLLNNYKYFQYNLVNNKIILKILSSFKVNKMHRLPQYSVSCENTVHDINNLEVLNININQVTNELFSFLNYL